MASKLRYEAILNQEIKIFLRNMKENRELYNEARDAIKINKMKLDWKSSIIEKEVRKKKRYFTSNYLIEIKKFGDIPRDDSVYSV